MKIGVLTSSRADFGNYIPLLKLLKSDVFFELHIIAFGTHLSHEHGYTISEINSYDFDNIHQIETLPSSDSPQAVANSMGETISKFSFFWETNSFDLVFAYGDRYEMFAAVSSGSPFNITFAHIHAGETTLGAIDNAFRHSISHFSKYLFVSTSDYKEKAIKIADIENNVFEVGALSIDNLLTVELYTLEEVYHNYGMDLRKPTILSTFHPETIEFENNKFFINEILASFDVLKSKYQIIITLPNTDTMGQLIRDEILKYKQENPEIAIVESFGMKAYLSVMKHVSFLLGNTSSGFVEASFFPKFVINLGNRQKGRVVTPNIFNSSINKEAIIQTVSKIENFDLPSLKNIQIYGNGNAAKNIVEILKKVYVK